MSIFSLFFIFLQNYVVYFLESDIADIGVSIFMIELLWSFNGNKGTVKWAISAAAPA